MSIVTALLCGALVGTVVAIGERDILFGTKIALVVAIFAFLGAL